MCDDCVVSLVTEAEETSLVQAIINF
jgi:hypothetical protein